MSIKTKHVRTWVSVYGIDCWWGCCCWWCVSEECEEKLQRTVGRPSAADDDDMSASQNDVISNRLLHCVTAQSDCVTAAEQRLHGHLSNFCYCCYLLLLLLPSPKRLGFHFVCLFVKRIMLRASGTVCHPASQTLGTFRRRLKTHLFAVSLT